MISVDLISSSSGVCLSSVFFSRSFVEWHSLCSPLSMVRCSMWVASSFFLIHSFLRSLSQLEQMRINWMELEWMQSTSLSLVRYLPLHLNPSLLFRMFCFHLNFHLWLSLRKSRWIHYEKNENLTIHQHCHSGFNRSNQYRNQYFLVRTENISIKSNILPVVSQRDLHPMLLISERWEEEERDQRSIIKFRQSIRDWQMSYRQLHLLLLLLSLHSLTVHWWLPLEFSRLE